jgi:hypothetical protein
VLVLGLSGCGGGGRQTGDADADATDAVEAVDTADVPETLDAPDLVETVEDTLEDSTGDITEVEDATEVEDVTEVEDAVTDPDADDASDAPTDATPVTPSFASPVTDPFGMILIRSDYYVIPALADMDGDGDIDLLLGEVDYSGGTLHYYRNDGSPTSPAFGTPVSAPWGISGVGPIPDPVLGDLDGDGDNDLVVGLTSIFTVSASFAYYENTGSATSPAFAAAATNPFGLADISSPLAAPDLADLDDDGDLDLVVGTYYASSGGDLLYFRNTGSATSPTFAALSRNPFGLTSTAGFSEPAVADLDEDGDIDLLVAEYYGTLVYFENTGSPSSPAFGAPAYNPFGLVSATADYAMPAFADIDSDGDADLFVGDATTSGAILLFFENTTH